MKNELWSDKIPYIKTMKEFYSKLEYKGLNLWPIMANDIYTYYQNQEQRTKKEKTLETFKNFLLLDRIKTSGEKNKILATYFMARKDHHLFFLNALKQFNEEELNILDFYEKKIKSPLKRSKISFPKFFLLLKIIHKFKKEKLKEILGDNYWLFVSKTYLRHKQINQFEKIYKKYNPRGYIAFCSAAFPEEAILTLFCNKDDIPTFSLQHGFYSYDTKKFAPIFVQSENIISKYLLLWGQNSYDVQKKHISEGRLIIAGNPKYTAPSKREIKDFSLNILTVFLSVPPHEESNKEIVKIINKFAKNNPKIKINIKIHPFDKIENYSSLISESNINFTESTIPVQDLINQSEIIITHYTTIEIEALLYGIPILRYKDKESLPFWKNDDQFANIQELENLIIKLKNKDYLKEQLNFYDKELNKNFYFENNKSPSEVYYNRIMKIINKN